MAKAALEMAVLDAELRAAGTSLGRLPRRGPRPRAVRASRSASWTRSRELLDAVGGYLDEGYVRIKLKIEPGWDVEPVARRARAVRRRRAAPGRRQHRLHAWPTRAHLARLDAFDLLLIEQPLPEDDLRRPRRAGPADRARRSASTSRSSRPGPRPTRSRSAPARSSTSSPAGSAATSRPGGSTTCARRNGVPVWCGGMLETGIGRAANVALAALPGFTLPGDTSASDRYYARDITEPFVLDDGHVAVPTGPGLGVTPDLDIWPRSPRRRSGCRCPEPRRPVRARVPQRRARCRPG